MVFAIVLFFITLGFVLIVLQIALGPLLRKFRSNRKLSREGVEAEAVLLHMQQTGLYVNNLPQVKLQVQVQPRTGRNFVTEAHEVLSFVDMSRLRIGGVIMVKYNPYNTREVMIVRQ